VKRLFIVCALIAFAACIGCGGGTSIGVPDMNGTWTMVFTGPAASQGVAPPPSTTLTATLNQTGDMLSGTVIGHDVPQSSCLFGITNSVTRFTVSGTVTNPVEAGSNLQVTLKFVTGPTDGLIQAQGAASETEANGLFSVVSSGGACKGGTFTMTKAR
jgi:hypothetical protein